MIDGPMTPGPLEVGHDGRCNSLVHQQPPEGGKRCTQVAGWGTDHVGAGACKLHGGSTPSGRAKGAAELEARRRESALGQILAELGEAASERGIEEVLLEQVWRAAAMARALEVLVGERGEAGLVDGDGVSPLAEELRRWTVEAARLSKLALDAGYEQRRIELAEGQAQVLANALRSGMAGLLELVAGDVPAERLRELEAEVPAVLRRAIEGARVIDVGYERSA